MDLNDIKYYFYALLTAVKNLADFGIIHRDIKPSNFLYDTKTRTGLLIDFGLSEVEMNSHWTPTVLPENETIKRVAAL
jgi:cell division control protein 7